MNLSVFYDHIIEAAEQSGKSVIEILRFCNEQGISAVEINFTQLIENRSSICSALSNAKLDISCIYEIFSFENAQSEDDIVKAKKMLKVASELNVSKILIVPGALNPFVAAELISCSDNYEHTEIFMNNNIGVQNICCSLNHICTLAKGYGITVMLEDFDGFYQPFARTYPLLWFMKNVSGLRYALDTGNFAFSDEDVVFAAKILKDYIVHVHCKDRALNPNVNGKYCRGLAPSPVGNGYIPIRELLTTLKESGYNGYLAIEHFSAPTQLSFIEKSANFLKNLIK